MHQSGLRIQHKDPERRYLRQRANSERCGAQPQTTLANRPSTREPRGHVSISSAVSLRQLKGAALDLLFPPSCVGCGRRGALICSSCTAALPRVRLPLCARCGRSTASGLVCPDCASHPGEIDGIRSVFRFEGCVRQAVHHLKYRGLKALAPPLAHHMARYLDAHPLPRDVLVPVPLHPRRLRERGYNQSALLAREMAAVSPLSVDEGCLVRRANTPPQTRTRSAEERHRNIAGAFACQDARLKGKQVLLVDDVCTSGATLNACAKALKAGGAASVWALTLAREPWY